MAEPLVKVKLFCEWESLFVRTPPEKTVQTVYRDLVAKGVSVVFISEHDPAEIYAWTGRQYFPDAIISSMGIRGYKGRDIVLPESGKPPVQVIDESIARYLRLAGLDGDILIITSLTREYTAILTPYADLAAVDPRSETPRPASADTGIYLCDHSAEKAFLEYASAMTSKLTLFIRKGLKKDE